MMTNLTLNPQDAEQVRYCLGDLLNQMTADEQQAQAERRTLAAALPPEDGAFSFLEELELLTSDLRGYAMQMLLRGRIENEPAAIAHLQKLRLGSLPALARVYFDPIEPYPRIKAYLQRLDYLRLLLWEYLQAHTQPESA
jgi:hypothetical protein